MEKGLLISTLLVMLTAHSVLGAVITATSCQQPDVIKAVLSAAAGDIVAVPAGTCTWQSTSENAASINIDKEITLQGAGIDKTVIADNTGQLSRQHMLAIGSGARVTGFTFTDMPKRNAAEPAISASGTGWRIDSCRFTTSLGGRGVSVKGTGVVDGCIFENTKQGVQVFGDGDASWNEPLSLGSGNAVFVEDNLFQYARPEDGALDAYNGARYVFRHNRLYNTNLGHHGLDSGGYRSVHSFEIYNNSFHANMSIFTAWRARGGTGILFGNRITGLYNSRFLLVNYRTCCDSGALCGSWGKCDGSNPIDGNLDASGWPCRDQVGRTTDADGDGMQDQFPVHEWDNTHDGKDFNLSVSNPWSSCINPSMYDHIKEGRDFVNDLMPEGYLPYTYPHPLRTGEPEPYCGDGVCSNETCLSCPADCGTCRCVHHADLEPCDGCISQAELMAYIRQWKTGNAALTQLMEAISIWKEGC